MNKKASDVKIIHHMVDGSKQTELLHYRFNTDQIPFYARRLITELSKGEFKAQNE